MMNEVNEGARPEMEVAGTPAGQESQPAPASRSALLIVFLVVFIDLLGFGIVLPLLPLYANEMITPLFPGEANRAIHGLLLGLLMASFSAMQFIFAPIWGRISDRIGRRPILLLGLAASMLFYTLFGLASELPRESAALALALLFVARLGAGIAGATISTAQAVIADCTTPDRRARGMALIGVAFGIGFTFGPLLGFASLFFPYRGAPGYMAGGLSFIALLLGLRLLPETLRAGSHGRRRHWFDPRGLVNVLRTPAIGILVATFFLATLAFGGLESTLSLMNEALLNPGTDIHHELTLEAARTTERKNFLVFAYVGFILMLTQGLIYRRFVQRVGEVRFMRAGVALMACGLGAAVVVALYADVSYQIERWIILGSGLAVMSVAVIGFALLTPSVQSLISRRSDPAMQGEVLGVNQSASALARILGPMVGLSLFTLTPSHVLPYGCGALLLGLVFFLTLRVAHD
jgi:MFS family permease